MGEMADFNIEQGGGWGIDDYASWGPPVARSVRSSRRSRVPTCKYCGSTAVKWEQRKDKWILMDLATSKAHSCKEYFASKQT